MSLEEKKQNQEEKIEKKEDSINLKEKFEQCEKEKNEHLAGWQRARADLSNYKKEEAERLEEFLKYVVGGFILKILPILDNFNLAEKKISEKLKEDSSIKGLLQIKNQIIDFFKSQGIEEIETLEKEFNPNFHEAVAIIDSDKDPETIIEEIQKGYLFRKKLIRPAKVKIAK